MSPEISMQSYLREGMFHIHMMNDLNVDYWVIRLTFTRDICVMLLLYLDVLCLIPAMAYPVIRLPSSFWLSVAKADLPLCLGHKTVLGALLRGTPWRDVVSARKRLLGQELDTDCSLSQTTCIR